MVLVLLHLFHLSRFLLIFKQRMANVESKLLVFLQLIVLIFVVVAFNSVAFFFFFLLVFY